MLSLPLDRPKGTLRERRSMSVSQVAANAKKKDIDEAKETSDDFAFQTDEVGFLPFFWPIPLYPIVMPEIEPGCKMLPASIASMFAKSQSTPDAECRSKSSAKPFLVASWSKYLTLIH